MPSTFLRAVRRAAVFCLVVTSSLGTAVASRAAVGTDVGDVASSGARSPATLVAGRTVLAPTVRSLHASTPVTLHGGGASPLLAYAPPPGAARPPRTVVYLHGVHGRADKGCPWFRSGASDVGWLVCPEGPARDDGAATASWGGDVAQQGAVVARALRAAEAEGASTEPGVAIGFSQGGYVALDLVRARLGRFRGLVLIAAPEAHPSAQKLKEAGVVRVALAAGSLDGAHAALVADAARLVAEGMDARFFDLGAVGHTYAAEDPAALREAIAWAGGPAS